jgi:hypothetical protein
MLELNPSTCPADRHLTDRVEVFTEQKIEIALFWLILPPYDAVGRY